MNTIEALQTRKSVRGYTTQLVEDEKLKTILKYGNKAPNAGPFHISVIKNPVLLQTMNDTVLEMMKNSDNEFMRQRASIPNYQPLYAAPILLLLSAPDGGNGGINAACSVTTMSIAATELGLGSCFVMAIAMMLRQSPELHAQVGIPEGYAPQCGMLLGYESENQIPGRPRQEDYSNINYVD